MTLLTLLAPRAGSTILLSAAMSGSGTLTPSLIARRVLSSGLSGNGALAPSLVARRPLTSSMSGSGAIGTALVAKRLLTASIVGDGSLTPALVATRPLTGALSGSGALNGSIGALRLLSIGLEGDSAVSASLVAVRPVSAELQGSGALAAQLSPPSLSLALSGSGVITVDLVNANVPGGATEPASYRPRYGRIYPAFVQPPAPEPLIIEEVAWDDDFVELEPRPLIGAVAMRGSGSLDVVLSVYRPLPTPEPRAPESPEIFPWWEHPTEEEIALLLLVA